MTGETYTRDQVVAALNRAADALSDHDYEDSHTIRDDDLVNLMVNLAMGFLEEPGKTMEQVIEASYGEDPETVLGWIA